MKRFFKHSGLIVGAVLAAVLLLLLVASLFGGGLHSLRDLFAPADRLVNAGMRSLEHLYASLYRYEQLEEENASLRARIAEMEETVRQSVSSNEENARLRKLLGLAEEHQDYRFVDASVVSWTSSSWSSSFTINRGTLSGVEKGDCVVTEDGFLIGRITEAGRNSALVLTILDSSSGVGAMIDRTGASAVAEGDYTLMDSGRLKLSYIAELSAVVSGDVVITSGKGGIYPSGLIVGQVESVGLDPDGLSAYAIVAPSADIAAVTELFVITDYVSED